MEEGLTVSDGAPQQTDLSTTADFHSQEKMGQAESSLLGHLPCLVQAQGQPL